ncbi:hypothetical protein CHLRE_04g217750v5 [Chlamydomonas reinhardtii]|uniref:Uncharacterized protein n=1 Tax=Chlamydomonas reinhardtii TaxID=3055 RepID=A0A2K3DTD7_CHLRE|nr:uncharacterized protein CHLRE_04g217750v5 [Chlamydomonas reinhardtii]PNW83794.1 hypothetical protein CHLRE_04g217750v5 [Chlamydomonas reinhardtii]
MSSDDDDELAALRAQRAARTGGAATLSQLKDIQRRAEALKTGDYFEASERPGAASGSGGPGVGPPRPPAQQGPPRPPPRGAGKGKDDGAEDEDGEDDDEEEGDEEGDAKAAAGGSGGAAGGGGRAPRAPKVVWVEEPDRLDDPLRAALPMSFGLQEQKVAMPSAIHTAFRRSASPPAAGGAGPGPGSAAAAAGKASFGPPRPPPKGGSAAFGPPRPPAKGGAGAGGGAAGGGAEGGGEEDEVGPPRPPPEEDGEEGDADVGPPRPPPESDDDDDDNGGGGDPAAGDEDGEEDDPYGLPITHEAIMKGHTKAVACLDVEHSGTRMVTGSYDYTVRIYDFHGMKSDMRSFRDIEPSEGHPVLSVSWSPSGDAFLVVTGSAQAKIYDRDGRALGEFIRGDMYIRDSRNTKGHISGCTGGWWHPSDKFTALTSSEDGTVRVWDTHNIAQKTVIKPSLAKPVRTAVTAVSYNTTGSLIGAGLADGTIQVWSVGGKFGTSAAVAQVLPPTHQMIEKQGWTYVSRPTQLARNAHQPGTEITSLCFSSDNTTLISRGVDATLKIWDLRKFNAPLKVHGGLSAPYAQTRAIFSPDESVILTGTGGTGAGGGGDAGTEGSVVFFSKSTHELIRKVGMPGAVTGLAWHHRLNQIFVGMGNRKSGETHALYDLTRSERGVLSAASRRPRAPNPLDFTPPLLIKTPHALPMYREDPIKKRKAEKEAQRARRPDLGMIATGRGKGGKLGSTGGTLLTQHLLKQRGGLMAPEQEMDPREAMLRHADKAKDEFSAWTAAYRSTQPQPMYAQEEPEEGEEEA